MSSESRPANADKPSRVRELSALGQSIWLDSISRDLMDSGKLDHLIRVVGIRGMTSNPTIFEKAINGSASYDEEIAFLAKRGYNAQQILRVLMVRDIQRACDFFRPVHRETRGADGFVSIEVNPLLAHKTGETIAEARLLHRLVDRPNLMVKVPGTPEGMPAIEALTALGMSINVTLLFSPKAYQNAAQAYIRGLETFVSRGGDPSRVHSVASVFVSRIDTLVDKKLQEVKNAGGEKGEGVDSLLGRSGMDNSRIIYRIFRELFHGSRFSSILARGGHVQRPLWASTGTKNPAYSDVLYVDSLIAPETVNTVPEATLNFFLDHGTVRPALEAVPEKGPADPDETFRKIGGLGIRMDDVFDQLVAEGVKAFDQSFVTLTGVIEEKARSLATATGKKWGESFGSPRMEETSRAVMTEWEKDRVPSRLLEGEASLFAGKTREVSAAMAFLTDGLRMDLRKKEFSGAADEIRREGISTVLWIGMGGSVLAPLALAECFPESPVRILAADTSDPETIIRIAEEAGLGGAGGKIPPLRIVVASQSGSTVEVTHLYRYFHALLEKKGVKEPGGYFWAVTDPGSPLEKLARSAKFSRLVLNTPGIPGRYSALSVTGLLSVSILAGEEGFDRALDACRQAAEEFRKSGTEAMGMRLGAFLSAAVRSGRDKVFLSGPEKLCLWMAQLIAESTGKAGKGLIPAGPGDPDSRDPGNKAGDRIWLSVDNPDSPDMTSLSRAPYLEKAGEPLFWGALFSSDDVFPFFLHVMAGVSLLSRDLGVDPFDAPDVGLSKEKTRLILERFAQIGNRVWEEPLSHGVRKPVFEKDGLAMFADGFSPKIGSALEVPQAVDRFLDALVRSRKNNPYLVVQSWLPFSEGFERQLRQWAGVLSKKYAIPAMVVRGPGYLHVVGQIHKGGPDEGVFLQMGVNEMMDLPVQGENFGFSTLFRAQQLGDYLALADLRRPVGEIRFSGRADAEKYLEGFLKVL